MIWTKIGIIIIGSLYSLLLPYAVYRAIVGTKLDIRESTLSYLSNKMLYDRKLNIGYTVLLLATALLQYLFFWLLSQYYFPGPEKKLLTYLDYSVAGLTLLACTHHNMLPLSFRTLRAALLRIGHNVFAVAVFVLLPALIIVFQSLIIDDHRVLGIGGFIIVGAMILLTLVSAIRQGINGVTELIFINGLSLWSIFITLVTVLFE